MKNKRGTAPSSLNVLFVGNSFTARNDVPGLVAAADGCTLTHRLLIIGGAGAAGPTAPSAELPDAWTMITDGERKDTKRYCVIHETFKTGGKVESSLIY
jgi:hypothetical protein